jgi:hypothetical protein
MKTSGAGAGAALALPATGRPVGGRPPALVAHIPRLPAGRLTQVGTPATLVAFHREMLAAVNMSWLNS